MAGLEGKRDGLSSRNWDDRQLLNMVESVLRRFFRSYWNLDAMTRSQVDRLRLAAAAAASNSIISALERRAVLTGFLDDVASIDAALPIIEEAMRDDVAGNGPGFATPKGISYLQALNMLRIMRDDPAHYVPRSLQTPRSRFPAGRAGSIARFKRTAGDRWSGMGQLDAGPGIGGRACGGCCQRRCDGPVLHVRRLSADDLQQQRCQVSTGSAVGARPAP